MFVLNLQILRRREVTDYVATFTEVRLSESNLTKNKINISLKRVCGQCSDNLGQVTVIFPVDLWGGAL